jgi:uncharacterized protein (DUF2147 family)
MKQITFIFALFITVCGYAQTVNTNPDAILHRWETQERDGQIYFRKSGNTYQAFEIYGKQLLEADGKTYRQDVHNPNPALRSRRLNDYLFIKNLVFKNGKWTDGELYYFKDGGTYDVTITIDGNVLSMRVYEGISLFGKTVKWNLIE